MFFTMDEVALIDGLIATYFVSDSVSEDVRVRYYETHQHLQDNRTDYVDLRNIQEALFFLAPLFHGSIKAFALTGRLADCPLYPGRCPGLRASALSIIFALGKIKR